MKSIMKGGMDVNNAEKCLILYNKIKEKLDDRDATFYRLAKETGISPSVFSDMKKGRSMPKADKIQKIADYFGVPLDYFYDNEAS